VVELASGVIGMSPRLTRRMAAHTWRSEVASRHPRCRSIGATPPNLSVAPRAPSLLLPYNRLTLTVTSEDAMDKRPDQTARQRIARNSAEGANGPTRSRTASSPVAAVTWAHRSPVSRMRCDTASPNGDETR
jgi:hypothetical protein